MALQALTQSQLPHLTRCSDYLQSSDDIIARCVERTDADGRIQKVAIGYFDGSSWLYRRWAFAPFANGDVPTMKGSELDDGISTWRRDHEVAGFFGPITGTRYCAQKSGDEFGYTSSTDRKGRRYILIPANGQDEFTGYVPAREVATSLKNGYLTNPNGYRLVADSMQELHLACRSVPYATHGFTLHGKVWWPVKNPAFEDRAQAIDAEVAKIEIQVRQHFPHLQVPATIPPLNPTRLTQIPLLQTPALLNKDDEAVEIEPPTLFGRVEELTVRLDQSLDNPTDLAGIVAVEADGRQIPNVQNLRIDHVENFTLEIHEAPSACSSFANGAGNAVISSLLGAALGALAKSIL